MDKDFIAAKLKSIMAEKGLNPMEFSELTGISRSTIEGYIKAKSLLKLDSLLLICEKLQISADVFLGLKEKTPSPPLTDDESEILDIYRNLDKEGKSIIAAACYQERRRMQAHNEQSATIEIKRSAG